MFVLIISLDEEIKHYISSDGTKLDGTFYDNDGGGEIKDKFIITKSG